MMVLRSLRRAFTGRNFTDGELRAEVEYADDDDHIVLAGAATVADYTRLHELEAEHRKRKAAQLAKDREFTRVVAEQYNRKMRAMG